MSKRLDLDVLVAGLKKEFPKLDDRKSHQILGYLFQSPRPYGFKCAVLSQEHVISFNKLYNFTKSYL